MASTGVKRDTDSRDELARTCARMYYEDELSPAEICAVLMERHKDVRGVRDVRSLIARSRSPEKPLVRVRVEDVSRAPTCNPELGNELERMTGIRKAIVVSSTLASDENWRSRDERARAWAYKEADALHYQLSQPAAQYLLDTLRPGDAVGVGPGRGTGFTMHSLKRLVTGRPVDVSGLHVFSLAGTIWVQPWDKRGVTGDYLDADENALELARALGAEADKLRLVQLPLFVDAVGQERQVMLQRLAPHLLGDDWADDLPGHRGSLDIAIFGVGAINALGTHYAITHPGPHKGADNEIRALREIVDQCPGLIVDIGDRFWVRAIDDVPDEIRAEATRIVTLLNEKIVSVSFGKLRAANHRVVIAGGNQKFDAVLALITEGDAIGVQATVLVTDEVTAGRLLTEVPRTRARRPRPAGRGSAADDTSPKEEPTSQWLTEISQIATRTGLNSDGLYAKRHGSLTSKLTSG